MSGERLQIPSRNEIIQAIARRRSPPIALTDEYWANVDASGQKAANASEEAPVENDAALTCPKGGDPCYIDEALRLADADRYPFDIREKITNCAGNCAVLGAALQFSAQKGSE